MGIACSPPTPPDPIADLAKAEKRFKEIKGYQCDLHVLMGTGSQPVSGHFFADKGRYHMDFEEDETVCDGKMLMHWYMAFGSAKYEEYDPLNDLSLGGMYAIHRFNHQVTFVADENGMKKYLLQDKNADANFPKKEVWIGNESGLIEKFALESVQYGLFTYTTSNAQEGLKLDERLFTPDLAFYGRVLAGEIPAIEHDHAGHDHEHEGLKHFFDY